MGIDISGAWKVGEPSPQERQQTPEHKTQLDEFLRAHKLGSEWRNFVSNALVGCHWRGRPTLTVNALKALGPAEMLENDGRPTGIWHHMNEITTNDFYYWTAEQAHASAKQQRAELAEPDDDDDPERLALALLWCTFCENSHGFGWG